MIDINQKIAISPAYRFQWEEAQQCYVLLYPEGMIQLNFSAGEILKYCVIPEQSVATLLQSIQQAFPEIVDIRSDVFAFLEVADKNGWITLTE